MFALDMPAESSLGLGTKGANQMLLLPNPVPTKTVTKTAHNLWAIKNFTD